MDTTLDAKILADLKPRLRGPLLSPADPGYDGARALWNGMIDRRPGAIARCLGVSDVVAKPLDMVELIELVRRRIPAERAESPA